MMAEPSRSHEGIPGAAFLGGPQRRRSGDEGRRSKPPAGHAGPSRSKDHAAPSTEPTAVPERSASAQAPQAPPAGGGPIAASGPPSAGGPTNVKETRHVSIDYNPVSGRKVLNTYEIIRELGRGEHGRVKLGFDVDKNIYVAIKLINRKEKPRLGRPQGSSKLEKIHREIAILKKCAHPNIVQLLEVLDDEKSRKIYLVLEYCRKGEIRWQRADGSPALTREQARSVARDVALGLEYLHINNVIHRDIKPANLLVADDNVVKISDFGVSYLISSEAGPTAELELAKTVGTPAFFSPELCIPTEIRENGERKLPPISSKVDVWAFGVTLFCFLYGYLPFEADNEYELFRVIAQEEVKFPDTTGDPDLAEANNLLARMLIKDPMQRPSISQIKNHPWLLKNISSDAKEDFLHRINKEAIEVSPEEVDQAIKGVSIKSRIKQSLSRFAEQMRPHSRSRIKIHEGGGGEPPARRMSALSIHGPSSSSSSHSHSHSSHSLSQPANPPGAAAGPGSSTRNASSNALNSTSSASNLSSAPNNALYAGSVPSVASRQTEASRRSSVGKSMGSHRGSLSSLSDSIPEATASTTASMFPGPNKALHSTDSTSRSGGEIILGNPPAMVPFESKEHPVPMASRGMGLMPMGSGDDSSLTSHSKSHSLHRTVDDVDELPTHLNMRLPELEIPRLDSDSFWEGPDSSSSSSDDDSGELTLVVGRDRTRSIERGAPPPGLVNGTGGGSASARTPSPQLPAQPTFQSSHSP